MLRVTFHCAFIYTFFFIQSTAEVVTEDKYRIEYEDIKHIVLPPP